MPWKTDDVRIAAIHELAPPAHLIREFPCTDRAGAVVHAARAAVHHILHGEDDRLAVVIGPCSIHDVRAAREYAGRLAGERARLGQDLELVMRVYFEKPRTTVGWKGLINDPELDGTFGINKGLRKARSLLVQLADMGLPAGTEFLDPITPQFLADAVTWGAIDAILAAAYPHRFLSVTEQGVAAIVTTCGNNECHVILRGGRSGTNYDAESVNHTLELMRKAGVAARVMVDTSHGNSNKDHMRQPVVARDVAGQVAAGQTGIIG